MRLPIFPCINEIVTSIQPSKSEGYVKDYAIITSYYDGKAHKRKCKITELRYFASNHQFGNKRIKQPFFQGSQKHGSDDYKIYCLHKFFAKASPSSIEVPEHMHPIANILESTDSNSEKVAKLHSLGSAKTHWDRDRIEHVLSRIYHYENLRFSNMLDQACELYYPVICEDDGATWTL